MDRNDAVTIAKKYAAEHNPSYYSGDHDWEPHEWVVEAILEAANTSRARGHNDGYDEGYHDGLEDGRDVAAQINTKENDA